MYLIIFIYYRSVENLLLIYFSCTIRFVIFFIDVETRKRDLEKLFEKFGRLREIWMARNPPCFAFVVYYHQKDADKALRETDGS